MTAEGLTKAELQRRAIEAWQALKEEVESLSDSDLQQPGVTGDWSTKDLMGHLAFWTQLLAENLRLIAMGKGDEMKWYGDEKTMDEWNEREWRLRRERPLSAIREELSDSWVTALQPLADLPDAKLQEEVKGASAAQWFALDTYEHCQEHLDQIRAWRRELETTEV